MFIMADSNSDMKCFTLSEIENNPQNVMALAKAEGILYVKMEGFTDEEFSAEHDEAFEAAQEEKVPWGKRNGQIHGLVSREDWEQGAQQHMLVRHKDEDHGPCWDYLFKVVVALNGALFPGINQDELHESFVYWLYDARNGRSDQDGVGEHVDFSLFIVIWQGLEGLVHVTESGEEISLYRPGYLLVNFGTPAEDYGYTAVKHKVIRQKEGIRQSGSICIDFKTTLSRDMQAQEEGGQ